MKVVVAATRLIVHTAALAFVLGSASHFLLRLPLRPGVFAAAWIGGFALSVLVEWRTAHRAASGRPRAGSGLEVLNIGLSSFSSPLSATTRKKFECLAGLARVSVVGFSTNGRRTRFEEFARFDLIPRARLAPVRFALLLAHAVRVGWRPARRGDLHIVVCEDPYVAMAGLALRRCARLAGRRVIVVTEAHGDWASLFHYVAAPRWLRPLPHRWAAFVLRRSDLIRTASRFLEGRVRETLAGPPRPVIVFPTYTDFELFLDETGPASRPADDTVMFVGTLTPVKGVAVLLESFDEVHRRLPRARLLLAGEGPLRQAISAEIAERGLADVVSLAGWLDQDELRRSLRGARVLVLPSLSEGLGRVLVEAMACGVPVVASRVGGIPELVRDGETGFLVPPGESVPLTERLVWILEHADEAARMGRAGQDWVRRTFSTERYSAGYGAVFDAARVLLSA